jgi:hypothetical protein
MSEAKRGGPKGLLKRGEVPTIRDSRQIMLKVEKVLSENTYSSE